MGINSRCISCKNHIALGIPVWKRRGQTARIHPRISLYEQERWGAKGIVIQAGKTILPTIPMAEVERRWLIQEIQNWLNPNRSGNPDERKTFLSFPGNRVELIESSEELIIQYPGFGAYFLLAKVPMFLEWLVLFILIYFLRQVSYPFTYGVLIALLIGLAPRIYSHCFPNTLRLNWDSFVLYKRLLGLKLELFRGSTGAIQRISQQTPRRSENTNTFTHPLVIKENGKTHKFGLGLSKPECLWLVHAIKLWLRQLRHKQ